MNKLKFELSVLFTKNRDITPISGNELVKLEYQKMFGKEIKDEELKKVLEEIIDDQFNYGHVKEVPEDYELI